MKNYLIPVIALFILVISCKQKSADQTISEPLATAEKADSFNIDVDQSIIYWQGASLTGKHNGSLKFQKGVVAIDNKQIVGGNCIIQMNTINTLSIDNPDKKQKLDDHLKSPDFFSVDSFPYATFKMNAISMLQDSAFNAMIDGIITIKDISKPLQLKSRIEQSEQLIMITIPEFSIDRTDFNIMYQSKKLFDKLKDDFINDEILLNIKIIAKK